MGAAAPVVGGIVASIVVSKAVSTIAPKLGFSESTSQMLGVAAGAAAGMYAGGAIGGGSTEASAEIAGATSSEVGTQLPAGYGGPSTPTGSGFSGTGPTTMGVQPSVSAGPAVDPQASRGALSKAIESQSFQAPATQAPPPENLVSRTNVQPVQSQGMLSQGVTRGAPDVSQMPTKSAMSETVKQQAMGGAGGTGEEDNWWKRLFSPEKTMDLAMAAMSGYGESKQRKWELEYPEKLRQERADEWDAAYGGGSASISRQFPSGY